MYMPIELTQPMVFIAFILVIFVLFRLSKVVLKALLIAAIGFSFPWIAEFLGLSIGYAATIDSGMFFAALAIGLFFLYEFVHFFIAAIKILTWPIRFLLGLHKKDELEKIRKEVKQIESQKQK